jgi:hypothetical protein
LLKAEGTGNGLTPAVDFSGLLGIGFVLPLKRERKNGLRTFVEDVEAIARVGNPHDITHCAVLVDEARQCLVS